MGITRSELQVLLTLNDQVSAKIKKSLGTVDTQTKNTTMTVSQMGQKLRSHWLAAAAAVAGFVMAMRGIASSVNAFAEFEQGLNNIKILLGQNKQEIVLFEKEVSKLATTFGVATNELLKSAFDIQSAVGDSAKSIDILNAATRLAVAGGSEMVSTTKGLVTIMESYGHELSGAADAADLLFIAQVRARATIGELAEASGSFLPLAAKLGVGVEEAMASFSKMTVVLGNVSESGTAMTGILNGLIKPTKELKAAVQGWFGVSVQQAVQQGKFLDIMEKLGTVSEEEIGRMIPRIRGLKGLLAVSQDINTVKRFAIEFTDRAGQTEAALATQMEGTARQAKILAENWHELNREMGALIAQTQIIPGMTSIIRELKDEETRWALALQTFLMSIGLPPQLESQLTNIINNLRGAQEAWKDLPTPEPIEGGGGGLAGMIVGDTAAAEEEMSAFMTATLDKQRTAVEQLKEIWAAYSDEKTSNELINMEKESEYYKFAIDTQMKASQGMWTAVGKLRDTFTAGMSSSLISIVKGTTTATEAFMDLGLRMVQILVDFALQKAVNFALSKAMMAAEIATATATGAAIAAAYAPAAANVSLATIGGAVGPASAALSSVHALAAALSIPKLKEGGIVTRPTMALIGEKGPEAVVPLSGGGMGGISVNIENASFREDQDIEEVFFRISDLLEEKRRGHI